MKLKISLLRITSLLPNTKTLWNNQICWGETAERHFLYVININQDHSQCYPCGIRLRNARGMVPFSCGGLVNSFKSEAKIAHCRNISSLIVCLTLVCDSPRGRVQDHDGSCVLTRLTSQSLLLYTDSDWWWLWHLLPRAASISQILWKS